MLVAMGYASGVMLVDDVSAKEINVGNLAQ
jgi:hypothetical protein